MKLSDYKGEDALEILADLIEPAAEIFGDKDFSRLYKTSRIEAVKYALKNKAKAVITVLAVLEREDPATYQPGLLTIPARLLEILNDPELVSLFTSQAQNVEKTSAGPATESLEATEI